MKKMEFNDIINEFRCNPRDVSTAPIKNTISKWFYVYVQRNDVYIASGRSHTNICSISTDRRLKPSELQVMLDLYKRRKDGIPVSKEATKQSVNQSYWFGIFKEMSA